MADFSAVKSVTAGGRFIIAATKRVRGVANRVDVTTVRGAATQLQSFSDADPYGDSTAVIVFPSITAFDDFDSIDLGQWLDDYSDVDIYWRYAATGRMAKVFEGFFTSFAFSNDDASASLQVQCQGALFQLDSYREKPFYPPNPWAFEYLLARTFDRSLRPALLTNRFIVAFPTGWQRRVPRVTEDTPYTVHAGQAGTLWTGFASRLTGSWDPALTGFAQDLLTVMITRPGDGVVTGNQWTIRHYRLGQSLSSGLVNANGQPLSTAPLPGRTPVLQIRDRFRPPDIAMWLGTPGLSAELTRDSTQVVNVIYGEGTDLNGEQWRNAVISDDGSETDYQPLAADPAAYPYDPSKSALGPGGLAWAREGYTKYGTGFSLEDGISIAEQQLQRTRTPNWAGTITLSSDPSETMSRWEISAGMTFLLKGFAGSGDTGVRFHISATEKAPLEGTVQLTVDTRYRDLLTVEESLARTRDPLTPVKMLQTGKASVMIEDIQAPWDYSAGSGYIPRESKKMFNQKPRSVGFPWAGFLKQHPPRTHGEYYITCKANDGYNPITGKYTGSGRARWSKPTLVLVSAQGSIARTELVACDAEGNIIPVPFHVHFSYTNNSALPHLNGSYSAFQNNAFEKVDPATGFQTNPRLQPDTDFIVGWGNQVDGAFERAGFWPGKESNGNPATGVFLDDSPWQYNLTAYRQFFQYAYDPKRKIKDTDIAIYAYIYCEWPRPVYFTGRLYRQNPGTN